MLLRLRHLVLFCVWGFSLAQGQAQTDTRAVELPMDTEWAPIRSVPGTASGTAATPRSLDKGGEIPWVLRPAASSSAAATPTAGTPAGAAAGAAAGNAAGATAGSTATASLAAEPAGGLDRLQVGVGDQIFITVFGQPDMSAEVTVNDNEQVTLPLIGTLKVGGLTPPAIEKLIAKRLKDGEYLRNPEVSLQVKQVRSQMISVLGEVQKPGRFPILGKFTVLDALATAGGLTPKADRTVFLLRRNQAKGGDNQRQEIQIRLDQAVDPTRGELDVELKNDDVVYVAQQKLFYVYGEVRRAGAYPMEPELNVMRALSISGGVTERGSLRRIRISRRGADQKTQEFKPDLDFPIQSGDVIYVDERLF